MRPFNSTLIFVLIMLIVLNIIQVQQSSSNPLSVSAIEATNTIGIYWDKDGKKPVSSVKWGVISPNQKKNVVLYVRNDGNETIILTVTPANWNPNNSSKYLEFSCYPQNSKIENGQVTSLTLTLYVKPSIKGINTFFFDLVFEATKYLMGDLNKDGVVDILDLIIISKSFESTPSSPNWNPEADLNNDDIVNILDIVIVASNYCKN